MAIDIILTIVFIVLFGDELLQDMRPAFMSDGDELLQDMRPAFMSDGDELLQDMRPAFMSCSLFVPLLPTPAISSGRSTDQTLPRLDDDDADDFGCFSRHLDFSTATS